MSDCDTCHGLSGEPPSVHVVLPYRNDEALIVVGEANICQVCASELADTIENLGRLNPIEPEE